MRYLLDTDHLSIIQRQSGADYNNLAARMAQYPPSDFAISVITIQEQMLGCHAYINRARHPTELVKGYDIMIRLVADFQRLSILPFDAIAAQTLDRLNTQRIQLARMDARIAAIALSRSMILLTRHHRDFSKVTGLVIEDWTIGR
ncbi:MAG: type II toxin-antitoxin system VapC family toxin [Limnospira sp. PMC 894.15]|uniref:type II toxin-antitoxin system VapC family toxin n=1 Tax=unclassified Limnospira TaxID=2642885 RepID=UPI0028E13BE2|nr:MULTISPECIES: type II toxin-antitoxin system VapC family toxin [unclassified Limnospira]MDT9186422.1 type II toxin-antitoxin system VapC family toxin [Limnospira sp. PMC 894.15]MDT9274601.1 type II toxin-antitoxin system VapC family toxin [Limnospira sp. PMC 737.11]